MKDLREYIEEDSLEDKEIDEYIVSDLYHTSLVTSLRSMKGIEQDIELYNYNEKRNNWIKDVIPKAQDIPVISFDQLKQRIDNDKKSCDGLFYYGLMEENKKSILFEYKNVDKKTLVDKYMGKDDKSILGKVKESIDIIKSNVIFSGGYTGDKLVDNIHLVIIYAENDVTSDARIDTIKKNKVEKDVNGKQKRAASNIKFNKISSKKSLNDKINEFGETIHKYGLTSTDEDYFGISNLDPEVKKLKGQGKTRPFSMMSKMEWKRVIEDRSFFENWDWGEYKTYFTKKK